MGTIIITNRDGNTLTVHGATLRDHLSLVRSHRQEEPVVVRLAGDQKNTFYSLKVVYFPHQDVAKIEYMEGGTE